MEDNNLFEFIKNELENYDSPIDLDRGWQRLQKKRKSKKPFFFILLALTVISLFSLKIYNSSIKNDKIDSSYNTNFSVLNTNNTNLVYGESENSTKKILSQKKNELINIKNIVSKAIKYPNTIISALSIDAGGVKYQKTSSTSSNSVDQQTEKYKHLLKESKNVLNNTKTEKNLNFLPKIYPIIDAEKKSLKIEPPIFSLVEKNTNSNTGYKHWSITGSIGLKSSKQIFSQKNDNGKEYLKRRTCCEVSLETYSAEINAQYKSTRNIYYTFGLSFNKWFDRLKITHFQIKEYSVNYPKKVYHKPYNYIEEIKGDTIIEGYQETIETHYSRYNTLDIYFTIGKSIYSTRKFSVILNTGFAFNIWEKHSGLIMSPVLNELFTTNDVYKPSFGLGIKSSILLQYNISNSFSLNIKPTGSFYINSISKEDFILNSHLYRYGLMLGVKYRI